MSFPIEHPQFITVTVLEWKHLLKPDKYKKIILDSLSFLVRENRVKVYGFVIMNNHFHLIWQIQSKSTKSDVQRDFLKFTSQQIKFDLEIHHPEVLSHFEVNKGDRKYQFWKRGALSVDLFSTDVLIQKLEYIHHNPVKAGICDHPDEYLYPSAKFYLLNEKNFDFITHYDGP